MPEPAMNAAALLAVWEEGVPLSPVRRALQLLATVWPEFSPDEWAHASIGVRDERLLAVREELFGSHLEVTTACPGCGERIETSFSLENIRVPPAPQSSLEEAGEIPLLGDPTLPAAKVKVETCGYQVECRLPTSADLLEVTKAAEGGCERLLERCVRVARNGNGTLEARELPEAVIKAINGEMVRADPQADVQIELACPACRHSWLMVFDILSYLWNEIDDWAQRILREVHSLAIAYGWTEHEILGMSARRRRSYLDIIGAS
jgi:hypothetical protein